MCRGVHTCVSNSAPSMLLVLEGELSALWPEPYARPRALTPQSARLTLISVRVEPRLARPRLTSAKVEGSL